MNTTNNSIRSVAAAICNVPDSYVYVINNSSVNDKCYAFNKFYTPRRSFYVVNNVATGDSYLMNSHDFWHQKSKFCRKRIEKENADGTVSISYKNFDIVNFSDIHNYRNAVLSNYFKKL